MMECKCPELKEFEFTLNIDLEKFHSSTMFTNKESKITLINNNLYKCSNITIPESINIENIISEIKSQFCPCLQSRIDLIKFIVTSNDCIVIDSAIAQVEHCSNNIIINADQIETYENLKSTLLHEIVHIFEFCPPCRNDDINRIFEQETDRLFKEYANFIGDYFDTLEEIRENFLTNIQNVLETFESFDVPDDFNYDKNIYIHIPKYKINKAPKFIKSYDKGRLYNKSPEICLMLFLLENGLNKIIDEISDRLVYGSPNFGGRSEFLAVFTQAFCDPSNNSVTTAFEDIPEEFLECKELIQSSAESLHTSIKQTFNQKFSSILNRICNLWDRLYSDYKNCNNNFNNLFIVKLSITNTDNNNCPISYDIYLKPSDGGCCIENKNNSTDFIKVGSITRQNNCDCDFIYSLIHNLNLNKLITNCCPDKSISLSINERNNVEFVNDIIEQIIDAINAQYSEKIKIIRDLSEKNNPCSK